MKKFIAKILALVAAFVFVVPLAACANDEMPTVKVYMPDGAPAIALSAFMADGYDNTEFTVVQASTIAAHVTSGDADMAIMPVNAAAQIYNNGKDIVMLSVNTHGNLFIVGDGEELTLSDLVGKRLAVINWANVPGQVLRMLLEKADIAYEITENAQSGKIAVRTVADGAAAMALIQSGAADYALLAEPAVTTLTKKYNKSVVADVQKLWNAEFKTGYPQACLVAQGSFAKQNKAYVDKFLKDLAASDDYAVNNAESALEAIKSHMESGQESTLSALNADIAKRCNISTVLAKDAKASCDSYFDLLTKLKLDTGTTALAKVPDNDFYYGI